MKTNYSTTKVLREAFFLLLLTLALNTNINAQAPSITYQPPLYISKGGTYSGNWESKNSKTPAVVISTSEPVIIQNSVIKSAGDLIYSASRNCNVTIRNVRGYGVTPTVDNKPKGRFFLAYTFTKAVIENNYMESTSGIYLDTYTGSTTAAQTIQVRYNKAKNIDGRFRNGGRSFVQFCVLNNVRRVNNIEIAWNEVINRPNESAVEDNINMHFSSGTSSSPIAIHDNYIQGSYPLNVTAGSHSGGGIMLADGANATSSNASSYVKAYNNHIVGTVNYGIGIAGGNNNLIYNNRVIASGYVKTSSGTVYLPAQNVGIYILNVTNVSSSVFYNNSAKNNFVGWINKETNTGRNDYYLKQGVNCTNNTSYSSSITLQTEVDEYNRWLQKVSANGKKIGVITSSTTTSTTKRFEAEKYSELADPGSYPIITKQVSSHSAGVSVRMYDAGDKIRLTFSLPSSGTYSIRARVRSGYYTSSSSSPTGYFDRYGFYVNGTSVAFTGISSSVSGKDASYEGSYWGTMKSNVNVTLRSGTNTIDILSKKSWTGADYIEIVPVTSTARLSEPEPTVAEVEEKSAEVMVAHPNPVTDVLHIEAPGLGETSTISIYTSAGIPVVMDEEITTLDKKASINFQKYNLSKGLYLIKIRSGLKVYDKRIFKE